MAHGTAFRKQTGLPLRLPRTSWGSIFNLICKSFLFREEKVHVCAVAMYRFMCVLSHFNVSDAF